MVSNILWAHNSSIFKDKVVPLEVTMTFTLRQAVEFKVDLKEKKLRCPVLPSLDFKIPYDYFDKASQGHHPNVVLAWFYLSITITKFILDMLRL
jgi:hypothetical protein